MLHPVQNIVRARLLGARRDRGGIRPCLRLGEAERAEEFASRHRTEELALLGGVAVALEDVGFVVRHVDDGAGCAVAGGDFLAGDGVVGVFLAGASRVVLYLIDL